MPRHIVVCGAGAAGLTAAIFAAEGENSVTLLERTDKAGKKILMSGGTRCNVLPVHARLADYHTGSSQNILKKIFKSWPVDRCKDWFIQEVGLKLACETESNKWFPESNSAKEVRDLLLQKALGAGVKIRYKSGVQELQSAGKTWRITLENGELLQADAVIAATGGLSIPTTGTDGSGHTFLKRIGHTTDPVYPALTPLTSSRKSHKELAGLSTDVKLRVSSGNKTEYEAERGGFLFTHRGYSGPAVLDVSHFSRPEFQKSSGLSGLGYEVNWTGEDEETWRRRFEGKATVGSLLKAHLPNRLAGLIAEESGMEGRKTAELNRGERRKLIRLLTAYPLANEGDEGYRKAEVTGGGVPLDEVDPATMESRKHPGLYLCGEIMDVFGRIGGFNFYWAWVSGRLAGLRAGRAEAGS